LSGLFASAERRNSVVCLLLALVTLTLYNPVTRHPFVNYDDDRYVTENEHVRQGLTARTISWALTSTEQANWHPLTWMSHALDCSLFRLNPAGHHLTSVLFHAANVMLLFLVAAWATGRPGPSFFVAAVFAVHPINVESVAWVAERKNVLCTFFFLLALGAYGWYAQKPGWKRYCAVFILFAAGLAAKPMVITLPFILLLIDYWPLERTEEASAGARSKFPIRSWRQLTLEKVPLLALSAASALITLHAQQAGGAVRSAEQFSFAIRIGNAIYAYAMYLWKMLWPMRLAPLYPHPGNSLAAWQIAAAALALIALTAIVVKFRAQRYLLVGWLWFLGALVPVIGLVQVGDAAMADRYAYIPLLGIFFMIAFGMADLAREKQWNVAVLPTAATIVLLFFAFATHRQIGFWQSSYDLWSHTLAVTRNNFIAEDNLGGALILRGDPTAAFPHFAAAVRVNPRDAMSRSNLGTYFQTQGRLREAVEEYQLAIRLTSDTGLLAETYANLGAAQRALDQDENARASYNESLRLNSRQFNAWLGLGLLARSEGKLDESMADLSRSIALEPTADGYLELGRTFELAGRRAEALHAYQQALQLAPQSTQARQAIDALQR
jgi:protein O-mannosyl-transferase